MVVQTVKCLPATQETQVQSLGWEDPWRRKWQPAPVSGLENPMDEEPALRGSSQAGPDVWWPSAQQRGGHWLVPSRHSGARVSAVPARGSAPALGWGLKG